MYRVYLKFSYVRNEKFNMTVALSAGISIKQLSIYLASPGQLS